MTRIYSDPSFASPRNNGGKLIVLAGRNGGTYPLESRSKRQVTTATSSGVAEAIECSSAVEAATRLAEMLELSRIGRSVMLGRTDEVAVKRGTVGTSGHQGQLCSHLHEQAQFQTITVSLVANVYVRKLSSMATTRGTVSDTCESCNFMNIVGFLSVRCTCRMHQTLAVSVLSSCMKVSRACDAGASEVSPNGSEKAFCLLVGTVGVVFPARQMLVAICTSQAYRCTHDPETVCVGSNGESSSEVGAVFFGMAFGGDWFNRCLDCEACFHIEDKKLDECRVRECASSVTEYHGKVCYTNSGSTFHLNRTVVVRLSSPRFVCWPWCRHSFDSLVLVSIVTISVASVVSCDALSERSGGLFAQARVTRWMFWSLLCVKVSPEL